MKLKYLLSLIFCFAFSTALAVPEPLARYTFNEGGADDVSGNALHGTLQGGAAVVTDNSRPNAPEDNRVLALDGSSGRVPIDDPDGLLNFSDGRSATVAAWVYPNVSKNHNQIFSQGEWRDGAGLSLKGDTNPSEQLWTQGQGSSSGTQRSDVGVPLGEWSHVAVTFAHDPGANTLQVTFYLNGEATGFAEGGASMSGGLNAPVGGGSQIGVEQRGGSSTARWYFDGLIDDLRIYEVALSAEDVFDVFSLPDCAPVIASEYQDPNVPENVLDESLETRWAAEGPGQWLRFCLEEPAIVSAVEIAFFNGHERVYFFDVEVSMDGRAWQTVLNGESGAQTEEPERFVFSPQEAKFVRITGFGNSANAWNSYYIVRIIDEELPMVVDLHPPEGAGVRELTQIEVAFNKAVRGVEASGLLIDGEPASELTVLDDNHYLFEFPEPSPGTVSVTWAADHGITDTEDPPNAFPGGEWSYNLDPDLPDFLVRINEFVASNGSTIADEDGEYHDWIELFNAGAEPLNLLGYGLSDDLDDPFQWTFPDVTLESGEFLLVWASGKDRKSEPVESASLHTNFSISAAGEALLLTHSDGTRLDEIEPVELLRDVSLGRVPDGFGDWYHFLEPTPLAPNTTQGYSAHVPPPVFSHKRGFYEDAFHLSLEHEDEGVALYYTTDGSEPGEDNGTLYTAPIEIGTTTAVRAVGVRDNALPVPQIATHSYVYVEDVMQQPFRPEGFPDDWAPRNPSAPHYLMEPEVVDNPLYTERIRSGLKALPTLLLTLPVEDVFGSSNGIYTHPGGRGMAWERRTSAEWIYSDDRPGFQVDTGIRIQGGASRNPGSEAKHSFSLRFRNIYGAGSLHYPLFEGSPVREFDRLHFRGVYNNSWTHHGGANNQNRVRGEMIRDQWARSSLLDMGHVDAGQGTFVHVYINGLYWGIYNLEERITADHYARYHGGEREDYEAGLFASGGDSSASFDRMKDAIDSGDWDAIRERLHIDNVIDHFLLNSYGGNRDLTPTNNWRAAGGGPADAQWRLYSWDAERVLEHPFQDPLNAVPSPSGSGLGNQGGRTYDALQVFDDLWTIEEFRIRFADRVHRHFFNDGALTPERARARWMQYVEMLDDAIAAESARWGSYRRDVDCRNSPCLLYTRDDHWIHEIERIANEYFPVRTDFVLGGYRDADMYPATEAPVFSRHGGILAAGETLAMSAPSGGTIYYTLNGEDPRAPGSGAVSDAAIAYGRNGGGVSLQEDTVIMARVLNDSEWSALAEATFAEAPVEPHDLSSGPYVFDFWDPDSPAGTYPDHMIFEQVQEGDPGLRVEMDGYWELPYDLTSRSRINGLGADGISFINTANAQDVEGAGYLGTALLALDTRGEEDIHVQWTAGTVTPNERVYALRLQYRVDGSGDFIDVVDENNQPFEYVRNETPGHAEFFGPVRLPENADDRAYVELRWKYWHVQGDSGPRAELRLDNVRVTAGEPGQATALAFEAEPESPGQSRRTLSPVIVLAVDDNGVTDETFGGAVTLSLSNDGTLNGTTTAVAEEGVAVFDDLSVENPGTFILTASADGLASAETEPFRAVLVTEEVMPRYMQGDQDETNDNNDRVPFAFRLTLEGLSPDTTYRYGNRVVVPEDPPDQNGAGNAILIAGPDSDWIRNTDSPRFQPEDFGTRHLTFTTDGSGSYTGWFVTEPTGNARFTPGNTVFIRLLLNDGADGEEFHHFLTTESPIEVLRFGEEADEATAIYGEAAAGPRNFVVLYDDEEGAGRPVSTAVIERTGSEIDSRYAAFYVNQVAGRDGLWGSLIPNTFSSGVRRVEERSLLTGETLAEHTFPDALDGTVDPSQGTVPVFADLEGGAVFLPPGSEAWNVAENWSTGEIPTGAGARAVVRLTADNDRDVFLNEAVSLERLTFDNETAFENRIDGGTNGSLTFLSDSGEASILVSRDGTGFNELNIDNGITLESDLRVIVGNVESESEFGALRIRRFVTGSGALIKDGFGVLSLTGDDKDYTGATIIDNGVLRITESSQPQSTSGVRVNPGGQLRLVSHGEGRVYSLGGDLVLDSLGPDEGPVALPQAGRFGALRLDPELEIRDSEDDRHTATLTNDILFEGDSHVHIDGSGNELTLSGTFSGTGTLFKSGGGDLFLTGNNLLFEGGTLLQRAAIHVAPGSFLGSGPLEFDAFNEADLELFLNNATQTVSLLEGSVEEGSTASLRLGTGHLLNIDQAGESRFQGSITGPGSLVKSGPGILRLTRGPNDFTGSLTVAEGVLEVTESSQPFAVSEVSVASGGQLRMTSSGQRTYSFGTGTLVIGGPGIDPDESAAKGALRQEGGDSTDVATVTSDIELTGGVAWIHANRNEGDGSVLLLTGDLSGEADLRKTGGGTLELYGANAGLSGGTVVENGTLRVMGSSRLGAGPLVFADPDRERLLDLRNSSQTVGGLSGSIEEEGSLEIRLGSGHTLTADQDTDSVFDGMISGPGHFLKSGPGILVLGGDSSLTGTIGVDAGVLRIDGSAATAESIAVASGARLEGVGEVSALTGSGMVAPGNSPGILAASSFDPADGLGAAFVFSQTGSPDYGNPSASGNAVLRLTDPEAFASMPDESNRIDFYLDRETLNPGDVFRGGFFTESGFDLAGAIENAEVRFWVEDSDGDETFRGATYSPYQGSVDISIDAVSETASFSGEETDGLVLELRVGEAIATYGDWRQAMFADPDEREDDDISGPEADPFGRGVSNLARYAFGIGLEENPHSKLPRMEGSPDNLRLLLPFFEDRADIAYLVEASSDIDEWDETLFDSRIDESGTVSGNILEIELPAPNAEIQRRFFRVRILLGP